MSLEGQKTRLMLMLAVNAACLVLAAAAFAGHVALRADWLLPVFMAGVGAAVGAQIWFVYGWLQAARAEAGREVV